VETKIHSNLPFEIKRTEIVKVFKNKLKRYLLQKFFIFYTSFSVRMINGRLEIRISVDMIWNNIDGPWTAILTN
jgi:hypothetical protein